MEYCACANNSGCNRFASRNVYCYCYRLKKLYLIQFRHNYTAYFTFLLNNFNKYRKASYR